MNLYKEDHSQNRRSPPEALQLLKGEVPQCAVTARLYERASYANRKMLLCYTTCNKYMPTDMMNPLIDNPMANTKQNPNSGKSVQKLGRIQA